METFYKMSSEHWEKVTGSLEIVLANTHALYLKTLNYHWNVTGPHFSMHHDLFGAHYANLAEAMDTVAERIRALGKRAPGSFSEFNKLSLIKEASAEKIAAREMLQDLLKDHMIVIELIQALNIASEDAGDAATADLAAARLAWHQEAAWMLRSTLE